MTLVKQGHESISTSHVAFLTPFLPREGCGRGWRSEEGGGQMTNPGIVAATQCRVRAREWNSVQGVTKNRSTQKLGRGKPPPRTPKLPFFLKIRGEIDFLTPASAPSGMWIGFGIKSLRPYICVCVEGRGGERNNNHLNSGNHRSRSLSKSNQLFAGSGLISPPHFMGICSFPRHPADTQIN